MSGAERDPKADPRPGDVLKGKNDGDGSACRRSVVGVSPLGNVFYRQRGWGSYELIIHPNDWRKWAATATVVHRAEVAE